MAYMCMGCYEVYDRELGRCPKISCSYEVAEIDDLMIPMITILNQKGYKTQFCCSGHVYDNGCTAYVLFDNYVTDLLTEAGIEEIKEMLPESWDIEIDPLNRMYWSHTIKEPEECRSDIEIYEDILNANLEFFNFVQKLPVLGIS